VPIALAGLASAMWGTADFLGGFATARWRPRPVAAVVQLVGLLVLLAGLPILLRGSPSTWDLAWGALAGLTGSLGIVMLYLSLSVGPMNVAAPTSAVVGAAVPVAIGLAQGERPSLVALVGVASAVVAVALVGSASEADATGMGGTAVVAARRRSTAAMAAAAGVGLGVANVFFAQTSPASGLMPLLSSRSVAFAIVGGSLLLVRERVPGRIEMRTLGLSVAAGLTDVVATVSILVALQHGSLVLVGVIGSLYPAATVVLARAVLSESLGRVQAVGLLFAGAAVVLIAIS
jgi:drug/metabolite transporter (DMT)-like permease